MVVLVTDRGFSEDDWCDGYVPIAALADQPDAACEAGTRLGVDVAHAGLDRAEWLRLRRVLPLCGLVRVALRSVGDTEAYDLARDLRRAGYRGRLRAHGAVAARFYTLLRRAGFDEVELAPEQARRQPREHWHNVRDWTPHAGRRGQPQSH
ncbi:MAG: DUF934 domain-containing protein [Pararhodobacter sp.]